MIYNTVNGAKIIGRVFNKFKPDYSDWVVSAPQWIGDALSIMGIYMQFEPYTLAVEVANHRAKIPCDIKALEVVEYENCRLPRNNSTAKTGICNVTQRLHPTAKYSLNNNGFIETTFESGEVKFHYKRLPTSYNATYNIEFPLVPDEFVVEDSISWYILYMMMAGGYKHPVFSLEAKLEHLNPFIMWETTHVKAKRRVNSLDRDGRELHKNLWSSFIVNMDAVNNSMFDNTAGLSNDALPANTNHNE